jgi:hypothetical protein
MRTQSRLFLRPVSAGLGLGSVLLVALWGNLRVSSWIAEESWPLVHTALFTSWAGVGLAAVGFCVPLVAFLLQRHRRRAAEARADYLAQHDPSTGLLNRSRFLELLDTAIAERGGCARSTNASATRAVMR